MEFPIVFNIDPKNTLERNNIPSNGNITPYNIKILEENKSVRIDYNNLPIKLKRMIHIFVKKENKKK